MIMNLFTKSFLVNDEIKNIYDMNIISKNIEFNLELNPFESIIDLSTKIKENRTVSFYFIPFSVEKIYTEILPRYCFTIDLEPSKEYFDSIINHNKLFEDILNKTLGFKNINSDIIPENIVQIINRFYRIKNQFEFIKIESEELLNEIPAEYFINMIGQNQIADKKFNNFRLFDIVIAITKVWNYLYNSGRNKEKQARKVLRVFENNQRYRTDELLIKYPELEESLKELFEYYGFNEFIPYLNRDLKEYVKLNSTMGYSSLSLYKYNKFLAEYIQKINYKIPTEVGNYA